jgi:ribosomal protein S16
LVTERRTEADEKAGTYDPIPKAPIDGEGKRWKDIKLDSARAKYWLGVGAQPSDPAWRLLSMVCSTLHSRRVGEVLDWELGWGRRGEIYGKRNKRRMLIELIQAGLLEPKYRPKA